MISPSKVQHQRHRQPSRDNSDTHSHVRLQKGRKPLEKKSFYLDIKNHGLSANLEAKIKDLGGSTELFLIKSVTLVVSDRAEQFGQRNCDKGKWGYGSGGSGGPPSLRSVEVPTPIATPPTPFGGEYPLSNSTNIRGQTAQRTKSRADAMLERALTQPQQCSVDPLKNAQTWGIPIWATKKLQAWLEKIYESLRDSGNAKRNTEQSNNEKNLKVKHLKNSYVKFESFKRDTRPVFLELPLWPKLNFDGDPGTCPFETRVRDKKVNKEESVSLLNKEKGKEMTRRPRATATRARRTEQLVAGCCEICRQDYRDLSKHVQSDKHLAFVRNDDNFLSLDKLINAGASVEAFLRANEVGQDCNLFPDGDRSLHAVELDDGKANKSPKADLSNFGVEDIKMVQCNGARRNLNLKLSSPHNLRTRAKHESGHLLRSKGSPWHELTDKTDKLYDKFEGFTIKKRSKGTIWIEEDDNAGKKCSRLEELESAPKDFDHPDEIRKADSPDERLLPKLERNDLADELDADRITNIPRLEKETPDKTTVETFVAAANESNSDDCKNGFNGFERTPESFPESQLPGNSSNPAIAKRPSPIRDNVVDDLERREIEIVCNGFEERKIEDPRDEKPKLCRIGKRARGFRGRPRLSVEERLIEDNRAYYKVEVLGNKLRSSTGPWSASRTHELEPEPALPTEPKRDEPSSEKPVVVRFKRVRRSELSLLSDEAESFMFGEPKRDDSSSEASDEESSVLPRETETDWDCNNENPTLPSSPIVSSSPVKQESALPEDDSQDSVYAGRARKRRRTQTEALIKDNEDYYKFETPGSRLRFQPPSPAKERPGSGPEPERLYPSKPSPEIEKMQFSFEAVPRSEPWYQTYQRQDEGAEFWHYFSEADERKPFLLPYEIENFHETLAKICQRSGSEARKKARSRLNGLGRSPRKSPRCHASTLAIMSTIIRKRETQTTNLSVVEEENSPRCSSRVATPRPEPGPAQHQVQPVDNPRSEVDLELREMAKSIDEMLCADPEVDDSFEAALVQVDEAPSLPKGPPPDLIELLDSCHEFYNCLENSSCASSECGEPIESPLKRRKRRKNRTGWPGIKMRKKLQNKQLLHEAFGDVPLGKKTGEEPKGDEGDCRTSGLPAKPEDELVEARPELAHPLQCGTVSGSEDLLGASSENSVTNDENHENLCRPDSNAQPSRGQADSKTSRKRQRPRAGSSETIDSRLEIENENDSVYVNSSMMRKNYGLAKRRRTRVVESEEAERREPTSGKRSRKRQRRRGGELGYEENRKDDYSAGIRPAGRASVKRRTNEAVQAEPQDADLECGGLAERVSPSLMPSTEMNNRRSSMEFQPVVRMMKIEDQVEIDHSILSVTVASNRRLRSSSSPRSNAQPPAKRYKRSKGPFGRWIKNS